MNISIKLLIYCYLFLHIKLHIHGLLSSKSHIWAERIIHLGQKYQPAEQKVQNQITPIN